MNEKEKAQKLVDKYEKYTTGWDYDQQAKECAKIAVEEIIEVLCTSECFYDVNYLIDYWNQVLKEIELI